eukprot:357242-Chlamydomonas_euryale.AAC.1
MAIGTNASGWAADWAINARVMTPTKVCVCTLHVLPPAPPACSSRESCPAFLACEDGLICIQSAYTQRRMPGT